MGVPKFFRYTSERYPCLSEQVIETQIPEFDHLYLDMNGIIHNCSHPDDDNVHFRITEEQIFSDIFHYIDMLFRMIQPRKLFFLAVDGVAPRAKMNHQRGRRFRSAKDAEQKESAALQNGETLPDSDRFDSNCITPGTAFMVRLQTGLKHFVQSKISANPLWRRCRVILSGHETPGEGEHKIMEYIRYLKSAPGYNPNTRHCLYGLDADLVMLGLCSHELHFSLLREEVKFGNKAKKNTSVDNTKFFLLHLGLMREYLELEFISVKDQLSFAFDIESIVDDWVLMGYLVGNDFIPNLPNFHINTNALPTLYDAYKRVLPKLDGYINESGVLNLRRLEIFLAELGDIDRKMFHQKNGNLEFVNVDNNETFGSSCTQPDDDDGSDLSDNMPTDNGDLRKLVQSTLDEFGSEELAAEEIEEREFSLHKRNYYMRKLGYEEMTPEVLAEQTECFVRALQWILHYYYRGVKSWGWYYPHHYAPYISDVRNFAHLRFDFDEGTPFLPFQQLLAVLPAASRQHLPPAYHKLMTSDSSAVIDFYPTSFDTDLNGKKQDWEAVVLIPFIDERRLIAAMDTCADRLTDAERQRNTHGPMFQYDYCEIDAGTREEAKAYGLNGWEHTFCTETPVYRKELEVADGKMVVGLSSGVIRDTYFSGFPTFKHHQYTGKLKSIRAKVFDMPSMNPSMVVKLQPNADVATGPVSLVQLQALASTLIGTSIYVGWPHLSEARVVSVSNAEYELFADCEQRCTTFAREVQSVTSHYESRMGIDIGETHVLIGAVPLKERKYEFGAGGVMKLQKIFGTVRSNYAWQTILRNVRMHSGTAAETTHVRDVFPLDSTVFICSHSKLYGWQGRVFDLSRVDSSGRVGVEVYNVPDLSLDAAKALEQQHAQEWMHQNTAASSIGVHANIFSQLTGTILIVRGARRFPLPDNTPRSNIGLQLKFPKRNEELLGYTKRVNNVYMYSQRAVDLVAAFVKRWPNVVRAVRNRGRPGDNQFETDLFEPNATQKLQDIVDWLKAQGHEKAERRACGSLDLHTNTVARMAADSEQYVRQLDADPVAQSFRIGVLPSALYRPGLGDGRSAPDATAKYELFDRIAVVSDSHSMPLGYRGTVIGIESAIDANPLRHENATNRSGQQFYDVLFDRPFDDGSSLDGIKNRLFKMSPAYMLNLTHGQRLNPNAPTENVAMASRAPIVIGNNARQLQQQQQQHQQRLQQNQPQQQLHNHQPQQPNAHAQQPNPAAVQSPMFAGPKPGAVVPTSTDIWAMLKKAAQDEKAAATGSVADIEKSQMPIAQNPEQLAFMQMLQQMNISANAQPDAPPAARPGTVEQYQSIRLEDMFRVDTSVLPQPPSNWRDTIHLPTRPNWPPAGQAGLRALLPHFERPHQQQPAAPPLNGPVRQVLQRPQGPQSLRQNDNAHLQGPGAFIPFQVTRANVTTKNPATPPKTGDQKRANGPKPPEQVPNATPAEGQANDASAQRFIVANAPNPKPTVRGGPNPPEQAPNATPAEGQASDAPAKRFIAAHAPNPKPSRLAARFDMKH